MLVERLQLTHFRNLAQIDLSPSSGLNWFVGSNGQGKTSVLEALGVLATLRSFRDAKPADWIHHQALDSSIKGLVVPDESSQGWRSNIEIRHFREATGAPVRKLLYVNQKKIGSVAQYLKMKFGAAELGFHAISFNPSDHELIRGAPSGRRAYLDRVLSAENSEYLSHLLTYQKVLEHRNQVLKQPGNRFYSVLGEFTDPLVKSGASIAFARIQWLSKHAARLEKIAQSIAPGQAPVVPSYTLKWLENSSGLSFKNDTLSHLHFTGHYSLPSLQDLKDWMQKALARLAPAESRQGSTLVGPHRDDWSLEFQGNSLRASGSQGEVRTCLLAMKLTEIESFRQATSNRPILLLDDFSSELDLERRQFLMAFLEESDLQVFVSSTEAKDLPGSKFLVEHGKIRPL